MKIVFFGDRLSKVVQIGRFLKRFFKCVTVSLWDGYPSRIFIAGNNYKGGVN